MRTKDILNQTATTLTTTSTWYSQDLPVGDVTGAEVDVNVSALTFTNVTIKLQRKGLDGVYYDITPSGVTNVLTSTGSYSVTLSAQNSASQGFGKVMRLSVTPSGSGSVTFTASIVGK